jgi:hypothetical protein
MSRIVIDTKVRHGKPVIKGTRVSIDVILDPQKETETLRNVFQFSVNEPIKAQPKLAFSLFRNIPCFSHSLQINLFL